MNELARTGTYIALAAASLAVAWIARPATIDRKEVDDTGQRFFAEFQPLDAKSLEIVGFNESTSNRVAFKVAQQEGKWVIPSHENYPADAQEHLAKAATSVMDIKKGTKATDLSSEHDLYGVTDPSDAKASPGPGTGTHITLQDDGGKNLVDIIVGKAVKDNPNMRFVRMPGKDRVYMAAIDTAPLSTKFEDWIERDLLKLNASSIKQVVIDNYSVDELQGRVNPGDRLTIQYDQTQGKWTMEGLQANEALQTDKLDTMRNSLSDLKIIDVHRKPAGLSNQLQGNGNMKLDNEALSSLMSRGYYVAQGQLLSNQGEFQIRSGDGVEYILRFGEIANVTAGANLNSSQSEADKGLETGRYLFVTATFDASLLEQPKYDPVPDEPAPPASQPDGAATQPNDPAYFVAKKAHDDAMAANETKRKEFQKKSDEAAEKVKTLNSRFADWYYVVPDSVFQKLKLKRADLVGPPTAPNAPIAPTAPMPGEN